MILNIIEHKRRRRAFLSCWQDGDLGQIPSLRERLVYRRSPHGQRLPGVLGPGAAVVVQFGKGTT